MRVTVCQLPNDQDEMESAWQKLLHHTRSKCSDFVLLPEMPFSPWLAASNKVSPADWKKSVKRHEEWLERCREFAPATVVTTCPVIAGGKRLNRAFVVCAREAPKVVHEKYYLPNEPGFREADWYDRGNGSFESFDACGIRAGVMICTDLWFFEHARAYGRAGIHLLLVPRATPYDTVDKWMTGGRAAAVVSGAYCLSSNLYNPPGEGANLGGLGFIIDPDGGVMEATAPDNPFSTVEIDLQRAERAKKTYPRYVQE